MTTDVRYHPTTPNPWEMLRPSGSLPAAWIESEDQRDPQFWVSTHTAALDAALHAYFQARDPDYAPPKPAAR